jgi:hypothetical protein
MMRIVFSITGDGSFSVDATTTKEALAKFADTDILELARLCQFSDWDTSGVYVFSVNDVKIGADLFEVKIALEDEDADVWHDLKDRGLDA